MPRIPEISVVIPTRQRPTLLLRAVRSALAQTLVDLECIVVVDGSHPATLEALAAIQDGRVRTVVLPKSVGASAARNHGVRASEAQWVAFLDDDDEWYPPKLELQLVAAKRSSFRWPIVSCQLLFKTTRGEHIVPRAAPPPGVSLSEYLFRRHGPFAGEGTIVTSSLFVPRGLLLRVPFDETLPRFQDVDWLLRAGATEGAGLDVVQGPLGAWHIDSAPKRISGGGRWQESLDWIEQALRRGLVTRRAYASFVMTVCAAQASLARDVRGGWALLRAACVTGRPNAMLFAVYVGLWLVPPTLRRWLRDLVLRKEGPP